MRNKNIGGFIIRKIIKKRIRGEEKQVEKRVQELLGKGFSVEQRGTHHIRGPKKTIKLIEAILSKSI